MVKEYLAYLEGVKNSIDGINSLRIVTDDSQLNKFIQDHQKSDNLLMLVIMPNFGNNSPDSGDNYRDRAYSEIMLLKKTDYSNLPYDKFIEDYDYIFSKMQLVKQRLLEDHMDGCNPMRFLQPNSITTTDVYNRNQCNGWNMIFTFDVLV